MCTHVHANLCSHLPLILAYVAEANGKEFLSSAASILLVTASEKGKGNHRLAERLSFSECLAIPSLRGLASTFPFRSLLERDTMVL